MVECWAEWEFEYVAKRGYRSISLDDFINAGGYGVSLKDKLRIKRQPDEKPIPHSLYYMQGYPRPPKPVVDLQTLLQPGAKPQMGTYSLPSTEASPPDGYRNSKQGCLPLTSLTGRA
ncbi:MAG: hypothetical protein ACRCZE_02115 [Candidatus Altimarinota bacterium]